MDFLPRTPNGKVDRSNLPEPGRTRPELEEAYVSPRTPEEVALAEVWAEVLGIDQPSVHDNFFELGGHSLMATRVISRITKIFGVELPLRILFEGGTVANMASAIIESLFLFILILVIGKAVHPSPLN